MRPSTSAHTVLALTLLITALLATAVASADGPVAAWDLAQVEDGWISDTSGNDHALEVVGATVEEAMGRRLLQTGPNSYAIGPTIGDGWEALTLVAVVLQARPATTYAGIVARDDYGGPDGDVFGILTDPRGNWTGRVYTDEGNAAVSAPAELGWHHLALTYDGTAARLYVDGELAEEQAVTGSLLVEPETPLAVGVYSNLNGWYDGGVAHAEIHDRALSGEELSAHYADWQERNPLSRSFTFAQASDTHVTDTKSVEIVNDGVDMINADRRVAFSLWLGDLVQHSTADSMALARMALERLERPWYALRGNHDRAGDHYQREFGELNYVFEYAGWTFIMLDSNPGDNTPIDEERMQWLRDVLAETDRETPLVLCTHHPLYPNSARYLLAGAEDVIALFDEHNLKAVLAGHYHANQEEVVDGVLYTTTVCLATTRTNHDGTTPRGYRLFDCDEDGITTEFVEVRDIQPEDVPR